jgi:hypothetical protein
MPTYSATETLFGQPVPPELDPALLLSELRNLRPVIDRLSRLEPLICALEQIWSQPLHQPRRVQDQVTSEDVDSDAKR